MRESNSFLPILLLSLLGLIFVLHALAASFGWYLRYPAFSIIPHFLGGFWIGCLALYYARSRSAFVTLPKSPWGRAVLFLAFVALVGVMWEFYEFMFDRVMIAIGNPFRTQPSLADTMGDLAMDLFGGCVFTFFAAWGDRKEA